jgi:6-phosphogluconolactonase
MIEVFDDAPALTTAAAEAAIGALERGLRANGSASLAATGGRMPAPVYDALNVVPLDWDRVLVTLTDERWVEPNSPESNERLVREHLLRNRAAAARFIPLHGPDHTPAAAAAHASAQVAALPSLDLVLLGMGEDGHVASLFPNSPALDLGLNPAAPAVIAVPRGEAGAAPTLPRLSLTLRPLSSAAAVLLLISGEAKKAVIERALEGADPRRLPVAAILQSAPSVRIMWTA